MSQIPHHNHRKPGPEALADLVGLRPVPVSPGETKGPAVTIRMTLDKECKGSVRYATADPQAPVTNVYLSRGFASPMPGTIMVSIKGV